MITSLVEGKSLRFPEYDITWAGECPWNAGFCFGTESGELVLRHGDDQDGLGESTFKVSEEAVNGVAFRDDRAGVSTRGDVVVARRNPSTGDITRIIKADGGAHGILVTPAGRFFAPSGLSGILIVDPDRTPGERFALEKPREGMLNFYKLIYLGNRASSDHFACAARTSGLLMIRSDPDEPLQIAGWASSNVDFIDVCPIPSPQWPHAVVGLCLDRSLVFVRDLQAEGPPETLRLDDVRGTPYSILVADGILFVLTSKELVALPDLLHRFLQGDPPRRPFRYRYTPIQAVDAYLAHGRTLMVVLDEEVRLFDIPRLVQPGDDRIPENGHVDLPGWSEGEQLPNTVQPTWDSLSISV